MEDVHYEYRAATMYYVQNQTMEAIGEALGVSRSTVSRLLSRARESGIVQITVRPPAEGGRGLARQLSAMYGLNVHVVPVRQRTTERQRLDQVAAVAARYLDQWFDDGMTLGVAWGTTVGAIVQHLLPKPKAQSAVVQLNGAANTETTGLTYATDLIGEIARAFDSAAYYFPVPAFFDFEKTKRMMWQERSIQRILALQRRVDIALFGVGAVGSSVPSHVYSSGYLDQSDMLELHRERVVGDVCTVLIREDGSYHDIALNARASGLTPHELRLIPRRVCVAVGETKVPAIVGALRAGIATDLVLCELTARAVLAHSG